MGLISPNDYEVLLNCIRELHSFADVGLLRTWLLDSALPQLIPSDWLSYNEVDLVNPANTLAILRPEGDARFPALLPRFQELVHQNPLVARQLETPNFPVHKISDFLTQAAFHRLELYQEVYQPLGVEYQIATTIRLEANHITAFALARGQSDYTERDRAILEMLRPHLVVAFNNLALHRAHRNILDGAELALKELSSATIIVGPQNRIFYHTGAGLRWIGATSPGVLPTTISDWLKDHPRNGAPETLHLIAPDGEIHVRAVPTSSPERRLLVLTRKKVPTQIPSSVTGFGLSERQLAVARWISEGKTNKEIAAVLGISPRTVQKHIEHIFEKMGVQNRVAVASKLHVFSPGAGSD
jgi:DNA-binding CsgD family transcriptional regulator